ncbi:glucosyltransferase domain-containing protein [Eubacterium callanderi]|uniref:glucosyltransferase domain-containing protein n=1 Tax=Eubacterium callanderi TaxID=53442 RepID=UPI00399A8BAA
MLLNEFKQFLFKNKKPFIFAYIFTLICFGYMFFNNTISIDEETWLLNTQIINGWLEQGRFGIYLFNLIFTENSTQIPFLWDFLAVSTWFCSAILFLFIFKKEKENISSFSSFIFIAYFSSLPFVVGQILSYTQFNWQISVGLLCASLAVLYTQMYFYNPSIKYIMYSICFLAYSISIYQAYITIYICAVIGICLLRVLKDELKNAKFIGFSTLICFASALIYSIVYLVIIKLIGTNGQTYLTDNYVGWFSDSSLLHALLLSIANIARVSFSITIQDVSIYGGIVICCSTILFILYSIYIFFRARSQKKKILILFFTILLVIGPFSLYLLLGTYKTQGRMLIGLPLIGGLQWLLILNETFHKKILKAASVITVSYLLFLNACNMNRIYYYDFIRYEHDQAIANEIMYDLQRLGYNYHNKPVIFIGKNCIDPIPVQTHDTLGIDGSFFCWDDGNIGRIVAYLKTQGYLLQMPSANQIEAALPLIENMPDWPVEGSIVEKNNTIIIRLSEPTDKWYLINGIPK